MTSRRRTPVLAALRFAARRQEFDGLALGERFDLIWRTNLWGAATSTSGLGSEHDATAMLRDGLAALLDSLGIETMLDLPCGDFGWMALMDLRALSYTGADIVPAIVAANRARYATDRIAFERLDLVADALPAVDLVLCRDCLVHLSIANIGRAIANLKASGSRWLLTTTFPDAETNTEIADGDWRVLNLQRAPFDFPAPAALINEGCTEADHDYADKSLGLWRIADLPG